MPSDSKKVKNILVLRFSAIGDVAMTVPALYGACHANPDMRFILLTRGSMASIFLNPPSNLVVIGIDLKKEYSGLKGMRRIFNKLRKEYDIDAVVDLHDVIRTKYICLLAALKGIKVSRIHKGRKGKHALTRKNNKVMLPLESSRSRYRAAFTRMGIVPDESFNGLFGGKKAGLDGFAQLLDVKDAGKYWVGIAPFAKHKGKIYPVELMQEVIRLLTASGDVNVVLFGGGAHEGWYMNVWAKQFPRVVSLADARLGFGKELALMSNLDCMVSMDSANMHLASIVGIPVVSIWGATHPYCGFKGWRQDDSNIIQLPLTCRPCSVFGDKPCYRGDYLCLNGIKPMIIVDKVLSVLGLTRDMRACHAGKPDRI